MSYASAEACRTPSWVSRDPKGRKDQGGEEIGSLRAGSTNILETRRHARSDYFLRGSGRSDTEDVGRYVGPPGDANFFKAGGLWNW